MVFQKGWGERVRPYHPNIIKNNYKLDDFHSFRVLGIECCPYYPGNIKNRWILKVFRGAGVRGCPPPTTPESFKTIQKLRILLVLERGWGEQVLSSPLPESLKTKGNVHFHLLRGGWRELLLSSESPKHGNTHELS